jgi:D-beta-D-heptose 7-phosphate kinase/D-beta-D-heptose 1-phosphate adenosyltransferase
MSNRLIEIVSNLPASRVVLVGDVMLDRYVFGNAARVSPEAPVPVLRFEREDNRLGGAGNVAACLATLGAQVRMVGVVGDDAPGREIHQMLEAIGVDASPMEVASDRPTVCKMRVVGSSQHKNPQQLMRVDFEDPQPIDNALADRIIATVVSLLGDADVLAIEDYNKGLLTPRVTQSIIDAALAKKVPVIIDPANIPDYSRYAGATALKMNRPEAERATGMVVREPAHYQPAAETLLRKLKLDAVIVTLDRHGAYLTSKSGEARLIETRERQVADGTGAGDMVLAMLTMARAAGATWSESLALANVAGGLEVEKFGVVPITRAEIVQELLTEAHMHLGKQRTVDQLLSELAHHRSCGKKIVFTNGCFDLIHLGHVKYFQFAKSQGDLLVVGVNTDSSIRRLKGDKRPIINEQDRLSVLEELESIDYLVKFDEDTPLELIERVTPDVLVKGADYSKEQVIGWEAVEKTGGRIALAPLIDGHSTSKVIQKILEAYK